MFVRWKKRISTDKNKECKEIKVDGKWTRKWLSKEEMPYTLSAYLVQSIRINGKPRQKTIAFIGSLKSEDLEKENCWFWKETEKELSKLDVDEETREKVYLALAEKTPRPSTEAIEKDAQERKALRAAWGLDKPRPPRPPDTPPLLGTKDTTEDTERPLFIKWKREYKGEYHAFLARTVEVNGKQKVEIVTKLASLEGDKFNKTRIWNDQVIVQACWRSFWYQVHKSLCKAQIDYDTYHETMRLLGKRIEQPAHEELLQIIQDSQESEKKSIEFDIKETIARYGRLKDKLEALQDICSLGNRYLSKNVEPQNSATVENQYSTAEVSVEY